MSGPTQEGQPPADGDEVTVVWHTPPARTSRLAVLTRKPVLVALAAVVVLAGIIVGIVVLPRTPTVSKPVATVIPANPGPTSSPVDSTLPASPSAEPSTQPAEPDFSAAKAIIESSVARVVASTCRGAGVGTGFWIDQETMLTSYSAVAEAVSLVIVDSDGTPMPAVLTGVDPVTGVAVLTTSNGTSVSPINLSAFGPSPGTWVAAIGLPSRTSQVKALPGQISRTGTRLTHRKVTMNDIAEVSGTTDFGMGGAPVVDVDGSVVGAVLSLPDQSKRLVVPASQLTEGVERATAAVSSEPGDCSKPTGPYSETKIEGDLPASMRRGLLAYFGGINAGDYERAFAAMGPAYHRVNRLDQIAPGWVSSYDFNIRVHSTSNDGATTKAWVTFDSIFARGRGPSKNLTCARWSMNYEFVEDDDRLEINKNRAHGGAKQSYVPC